MKQLEAPKKVLLALSGGVDSATAAAYLSQQGYEVIGVHFLLWKEDYSRVENNLEDINKIVKVLGIKLEIVDLKEEFKKWVVDEILENYKRGLTPNPCIICNKKIKFNLLSQIAEKMECDFIATGHYTRVKEIKYRTRTEFALYRAIDKDKDQSYFLYRLNQQILSKTLFPNGDFLKEKIRKMASQYHLPVADKKDSQEICFIPDDIKAFLQRHLAGCLIPGQVVDRKGNPIGEHFGLPLYTIGQRHGFSIKSKIKDQISKTDDKNIKPLYVVYKDMRNNQLVVGSLKESVRSEFTIENINWVREVPQANYKFQMKIKIRNTGDYLNSTISYNRKNNSAKIILKNPQIGITPGQSGVLYNEDEVLGGGIITG